MKRLAFAAAQRHRWKHRCPSCKKILLWEFVYCADCMKAEPLRRRFKLSSNQSRLKSQWLTGVFPKNDQLFVVLNKRKAVVLCVECGRTCTSKRNFKHRCYNRNSAGKSVIDTRKKHRCVSCKVDLIAIRFPVLDRKGVSHRSKICDRCLNGAKLVVIKKGKYTRKKLHGRNSMVHISSVS